MLSIDDERDALATILEQSQLRRESLNIQASQHKLRTRPSRAQASVSRSTPLPHANASSPIASSSSSHLKARKQEAYGPAYKPDEESLREDFAQEYVNSGRRPQNFLLGTGLDTRFDEYPRLQKLLTLHSGLVDQLAVPPTYLHVPSIDELDLLSLSPIRFDCILIDPPDEVSWQRLAALPVPSVAAQPSFIWIWCGSGNTDGLERGRELLSRWGYRRCEDIVWIKTNKKRQSEPGTSSVFTQTKEHCLMGIRGTVKRSTDAHFVHCNVDTDVIVWEPDEQDPTAKPPELYNVIENFCLGARRLQLFYPPSKARRGWLTIGHQELEVGSDVRPFDRDTYGAFFDPMRGGATSVPNTPEIDHLRPRSPPPRGGQPNQSGGGIGRGRGTLAGGLRPHNSTPIGMHGLPARPHPLGHPHASSHVPMAATSMSMPMHPQMGSMGLPPPPQPFAPVPPPHQHMQTPPLPFNPMMGGMMGSGGGGGPGMPPPHMFNPAMMMGGGMMPQAVDWTAFFQQQAQQQAQQRQKR